MARGEPRCAGLAAPDADPWYNVTVRPRGLAMKAKIVVLVTGLFVACKPAPSRPQTPPPAVAATRTTPVVPVQVTQSSVTTPTPDPPEQLPKAPRRLFGPSYHEPNGMKFHGYDCTVDCSGHEAGYEWAEQEGITDPESCDGSSNSFIEGCRAYAEEQGGGFVGDDDDDNDDDPGDYAGEE